MERLLACIERVSVVDEMEDKLLWKESKDGVFSVGSMYTGLSPSGADSFPWIMVWKNHAQPKICFFT